MGHIFISYSRKDEEYVNKLVDALENEGFEVWIDRELLTGDTWIQVINHKIDTCDAFVIVMTDDSKESKWVRREVLYAIQEGKKILPLLLQGKLWMYLQDFNFFKVKDGSIPDKKFFRDIEKTVPRSEAWLAAQRETAEEAAREKARLKAEEVERLRLAQAQAEREAAEKAEQKRKEKELREKRAREKKVGGQKPILIPWIGMQSVYWFGGFAVIVLGMVLFSSLNSPSQSIEPTPNDNQPQVEITSTYFEIVEPSVTITPSPTSTPSIPTNTIVPIVTAPTRSLPTEITDARGVTMRLVPAGDFIMGSDKYVDEGPVESITLNEFYIDKYEVTNGDYQLCVNDGVCMSPEIKSSSTRLNYYGNAEFSEYPVIYVGWYMADAYCKWREGKLPNNFEWEKAARGVDGRLYPWGEDISCEYANYKSECVSDTTKIGSYPDGISPYGLYDMVGNVAEWVNDGYDYVYSGSGGLSLGTNRGVRGGSWVYGSIIARTSYRSWLSPTAANYAVGIRCAKDIEP